MRVKVTMYLEIDKDCPLIPVDGQLAELQEYIEEQIEFMDGVKIKTVQLYGKE